MSDLSRLLDDVYGTQGNEPDAQPEWASEAALDDVFANWVPGVRDDTEDVDDQPLTEALAQAEKVEFEDRVEFDDVAQPEPASFDPVASFAESDMFGAAVGLAPPAPVVEQPVAESDMFGAAVGLAPPAPVVEQPVAEAPQPVASVLAPWQPSDDDLLPARRRGLSLSLRRR